VKEITEMPADQLVLAIAKKRTKGRIALFEKPGPIDDGDTGERSPANALKPGPGNLDGVFGRL
jgi:hypothetical protein